MIRVICAASAYGVRGRTSHNPPVVGSSPTRPIERSSSLTPWLLSPAQLPVPVRAGRLGLGPGRRPRPRGGAGGVLDAGAREPVIEAGGEAHLADLWSADLAYPPAGSPGLVSGPDIGVQPVTERHAQSVGEG
jgi:hypothetical protein